MGERAGFLSLDAAAERLGVHYMTAYRYVRLGHLPAESHGGRWSVRISDVDTFVRNRDAPPAAARRGAPNWRTYRSRIRARLVAGDDAGAWGVVEDALYAGASPVQIYVDVLAPVLRSIGSQWARGTVSIADEHRVTTAARRVVGRLSPRFARQGRSRGTIVIGGAAEDPHDLPGTMLVDVLRGAGFAVVDLGADTPAESFVQVVSQTDCFAVGVSASTDKSVTATEHTIRELHALRSDLAVAAGGPALGSRAAALAIGADGWAPNARAALKVFDRWLD